MNYIKLIWDYIILLLRVNMPISDSQRLKDLNEIDSTELDVPSSTLPIPKEAQ